MRRVGGLLPAALAALATLVACSDLKSAEPPADAGPKDDAGVEVTMPVDGPDAAGDPDAAGGAEAGRTPCPSPCLPELVADVPNLGALVLDGANVYFAGSELGVYQCPLAGCGPKPEKLADGFALTLALAGGKLYWGDSTLGALVSCAVTGCSHKPEQLVVEKADDVITDGAALAWVVRGTSGDDLLRTCTAGACTARTVATTELAAHGIALAKGVLYWPDASNKKIHSCPLVGGCSTPATLGPGFAGITADDANAFWLADGEVVRCALGGCNGVPTRVATASGATRPTVDDRDVYWQEVGSKTIVRCPKLGPCNTPELIATGVTGTTFRSIALTADWIYWTEARGLFRRKK